MRKAKEAGGAVNWRERKKKGEGADAKVDLAAYNSERNFLDEGGGFGEHCRAVRQGEKKMNSGKVSIPRRWGNICDSNKKKKAPGSRGGKKRNHRGGRNGEEPDH